MFSGNVLGKYSQEMFSGNVLPKSRRVACKRSVFVLRCQCEYAFVCFFLCSDCVFVVIFVFVSCCVVFCSFVLREWRNAPST